MKTKNLNKIYLVFVFFVGIHPIYTQNLGIGATLPKRELHLHSASGFDVGLQITNSTTTEGVLRGTTLRQLAGDFIVQNNESNASIAFATNNNTRMKIGSDGQINIGINPFAFTAYKFGLFDATNTDKVNFYSLNTATTGQTSGVIASNYSSQGIAIGGYSSGGGGGFSALESGNFGVVGTAANAGSALGGFSLNGANALRVSAPSPGYAISSTGKLKFTNIGEAASKVLTSDAAGNATWQDASASSGWSKNGSSDIFNNPNNAVLIGTNMVQPSGSFYNNQIGLQVAKHALFTGSFGGDPFVRIVNNPSDVPLAAGVALYVNNSVSPAAVFKSQYTGLEVESAAQNTLWSAGRFILNNLTSTANAFEISNNGTGYALTVNNIGAGSNATAYLSNSNIAYTPSSNIGIELNNSYLKVTGNARSMFTITTSAPTITSNRVAINYPGMSSTDMLMVTHVYASAYLGGIGVWWDGSAWTIFRQDQQAMPINEKFNVLVVKQ